MATDYDVLTQQEIDTEPLYNSEAEREELRIRGRHAEKSLRLGIRLFEGELTAASLGDALRLDMAVFTLGEEDRVLFKNDAAGRLLANTFAISGGRLAARVAEEQACLRQALKEARQFLEPFLQIPLPLILRKEGGGRVAVFILPMRLSGAAWEDFLKLSTTLVLATEWPADTEPDPAILRDLLGLTLGEARVASIVGQGVSPREAAARLGIAEASVRTVLKRVFSNIGVSRQSELSALLSRLAVR